MNDSSLLNTNELWGQRFNVVDASMDSPQPFHRPNRRCRFVGGGVIALWIFTSSAPAGTSQDPAGAAPSLGVTLWMRDAGQWPGYTDAERVRLDESVRLKMRIGETRALFPVVTGSTAGSNMYLDLCVPVDPFEVRESRAWEPADPEQWDCARYSAYIPRVTQPQQVSPREPLRFRALAEGTFAFRYRIVTAQGPPVEGHFPIEVTR